MTTAFQNLLSECIWIGYKATDDERKLIMQYAKRLREAEKEGVWVDPLDNVRNIPQTSDKGLKGTDEELQMSCDG